MISAFIPSSHYKRESWSLSMLILLRNPLSLLTLSFRMSQHRQLSQVETVASTRQADPSVSRSLLTERV